MIRIKEPALQHGRFFFYIEPENFEKFQLNNRSC